jgi:hypothetical protein
MSRLLYWLTGFLPTKIISDNGRPYLERYYLFTLLGVRFYLHRFVGSDPARGLHDHPWPWAGSVVLSGYYLEERRGLEQHRITQIMAELMGTTGTVRHTVRWFNWLTGDSFHRVVMPQKLVRKWVDGVYVKHQEQRCWTLFFHRAVKAKRWGFLRRMEGYETLIWVPHTDRHDDDFSPAAQWWNKNPIGKNSGRLSCN